MGILEFGMFTMKTLPAVFSCCHHNMLQVSIWAAQSTVNMSCSALYWCHQPGPAYTFCINICWLYSSQNQVAELLRLGHIVLERKEYVRAWAAEGFTDNVAEFGLTPARARGWCICWKLQGITDSRTSLGHIISWGHCKSINMRKLRELWHTGRKSRGVFTYWSEHWCWPDVINNLVLRLKTNNCF